MNFKKKVRFQLQESDLTNRRKPFQEQKIQNGFISLRKKAKNYSKSPIRFEPASIQVNLKTQTIQNSLFSYRVFEKMNK